VKKIAALLSLLLLSIAAQAAKPTEESINKLLTVTQADKIMDAVRPQINNMMKNVEQQAAQGQTPSPADQKVIDKFHAKATSIMSSNLTMAKLKPMYIRVYSDSFTQEEINSLIAFYESPTGKMFTAKMPAVMQSLMAEMPKAMAPMMQEMQAAAKEMSEEMAALHKQGAK
jgi:hypothetical protein